MTDRAPADTIQLFNDAFNRHDLEALAELVTDDCVFEDTSPPDGQRAAGRDAVLAAWRRVFDGAAGVQFAAEDVIAAGDRVIVLWRYSWQGGHVRGVDAMRVRGEKVSEKFSYVKG